MESLSPLQANRQQKKEKRQNDLNVKTLKIQEQLYKKFNILLLPNKLNKIDPNKEDMAEYSEEDLDHDELQACLKSKLTYIKVFQIYNSNLFLSILDCL